MSTELSWSTGAKLISRVESHCCLASAQTALDFTREINSPSTRDWPPHPVRHGRSGWEPKVLRRCVGTAASALAATLIR
jgi:hypothetical protein